MLGKCPTPSRNSHIIAINWHRWCWNPYHLTHVFYYTPGTVLGDKRVLILKEMGTELMISIQTGKDLQQNRYGVIWHTHIKCFEVLLIAWSMGSMKGFIIVYFSL